MNELKLHDRDLELALFRNVLGRSELEFIFKRFQPEMFYIPIIRTCYSTLRAFWTSNRSLPKAGMQKRICSEGKSDEKVSEIEKIFNIAAALQALTSDDLIITFPIIRKYFILRKVTEGAQDFYTRYENKSEKSEDLLDDLVKYLSGIKTIGQIDSYTEHSYVDMIQQRRERYEELSQNHETEGIFMGFEAFDQNGPLVAGQIGIIQAATNMGKSVLLKQIANYNFHNGKKVLLITIEMSAEQQMFRIDSEYSCIPYEIIKKGKMFDSPQCLKCWDDSMDKIKETKEKYGNDIWILDMPAGCTCTAIDGYLSGLHFKPDLIVLDYAGDMDSEIRGKGDHDAQAQAQIFKGLRTIARKYETVIWTAQQLRRGAGHKAETSSEEGAFSQMAAIVAARMIAILQSADDKDLNRMRFQLVKERDAQKITIFVKPTFHLMKFEEIKETQLHVMDDKNAPNNNEDLSIYE